MAHLSWQGKQHAQQIYTDLKHGSFAAPDATGKGYALYEGDNLFSLAALAQSNKSFDLIYIDPPYNTGNTGWIYEDSMQRDAWLSFMYPRLQFARDILQEHGVVVVSIGTAEYERLGILMDEVFGPENKVATIVWKTKSASNNVQLISQVHEYLLVYAKDHAQLTKSDRVPWRTERHGGERALAYANALSADASLDHQARRIRMRAWYHEQILLEGGDKKAKAKWKNMLNYVWFDDHGLYYGTDLSAPGATGPHYPIYDKDGVKYAAPSRGWGVSEQTMKDLIEHDMVHFRIDEKGKSLQPLKKIYLHEKLETVQTSVLDIPVRGATLELERILGKKVQFPYPKPVSLMRLLIQMMTQPEDSILDVFAGSGTLFQAANQIGSRNVIGLEINQDVLAQVFWPRMKHLGIEIDLRVISPEPSAEEILDFLRADWDLHAIQDGYELKSVPDWIVSNENLSLEEIHARLTSMQESWHDHELPSWMQKWLMQTRQWLDK